MKNPTPARRARTLTAAVAVAAVASLSTAPAHAAATPASSPAAVTETATLVDPDATSATRSLFSYLRDVRGEGILFGHQHTTSDGVTVGDPPDGTRSDVQAAVDDYPAIFGWDTLILEGKEKPGVLGAPVEQNIAAFADYMEKAHELGGINTISAHMNNFVTGGSFYDTEGATVTAILPGGAKHDELNAYLDTIATLADETRDGEGNLIPIIFRPWHENAGSWFWWGAAHATSGEFVELWRYTVEYLRDVKGVTSFLYAYSPGGGFGGVDDVYLRTYPGDQYVDVLGYDSYDASTTADSSAWLNGVVQDLGMIADLADAKGKISAFTEFGLANGALKPNGQNPNLTWYTDVLDAIKADPRASRSAYMPTWANFDPNGVGAYTPYPEYGELEAHELLPDFQAYAADPYSYFASDLDFTDVYGRIVQTTEHEPFLHVATPASGQRITASPATVRARLVNAVAPTEAYFTVDDDATRHPLTRDADGFLASAWTIADTELDNSTHTVHVTVVAGGETLTATSKVILGARPVLAPGVVDDFEGYGDDEALRAELSTAGVNTLTLETGTVGGGAKALRLGYDFTSQTYTGVIKKFSDDWSAYSDLSIWVRPDGSGNRMVLQLVADGVSFEAYPSLAGTTAQVVTIPFADWRPAPWDTSHADRRLTYDELAKITQFNIYVNEVPAAGVTSGSIVVDEIRATGAASSGFTDVDATHPYFREITWAKRAGVATGWPDGTYRPSAKVTRETLATFLFRLVDPEFTPPATPTFKDVPTTHPAFAAIEWLASTGQVRGDAYTKFRPGNTVARETVAATLYALRGTGEVPEPGTQTFKDVKPTRAEWAAIEWAAAAGVMPGDPYGRFKPTGTVSRADLAAFLYRYARLPEPPADSVPLFDFASGTQGWTGAGPVRADAGRLVVESPLGGGWFGVDAALGDLTGRTEIRMDLVETAGINPKLALKLGDSWLWCETTETGWTSQPRTGADALVFDLTTLTPECTALLDDVRGFNVYVNEGTHVLDTVEAR
jgi:mannan endo-1,4-beta-mannosidase